MLCFFPGHGAHDMCSHFCCICIGTCISNSMSACLQNNVPAKCLGRRTRLRHPQVNIQTSSEHETSAVAGPLKIPKHVRLLWAVVFFSPGEHRCILLGCQDFNFCQLLGFSFWVFRIKPIKLNTFSRGAESNREQSKGALCNLPWGRARTP